MSQRAMCNHLFLCHLFYYRGHCRFPPLHVFDHRLSFCSTSLSLLITAVNRLPPFSLIFDVILDLCYFPVQCLLLSIFFSRFCDTSWLRRLLCIASALPHH